MGRVLGAVLLGFLVFSIPNAGAEDEAPAKPAIEERWDFYFARINNADASVLLDMALKPHAPLASHPALLWVLLDMKAPDTHRMGTADEAERLMKVEREVSERLRSGMGARNVARIRGEGRWQLYYYAPNDKGLQDHVKRALARHKGQAFHVGSKADPKWKYYTDFLWPSAERLRWIHDRRVVDRLLDVGDDVDTPRDVEHWANFPDKKARKAFEEAIVARKFKVVERVELLDDKLPYLLRFQRKDPVGLRHIHAVAEFLRKAALEQDGSYDGWTAPVVKKKTPKEDAPKKGK